MTTYSYFSRVFKQLTYTQCFCIPSRTRLHNQQCKYSTGSKKSSAFASASSWHSVSRRVTHTFTPPLRHRPEVLELHLIFLHGWQLPQEQHSPELQWLTFVSEVSVTSQTPPGPPQFRSMRHLRSLWAPTAVVAAAVLPKPSAERGEMHCGPRCASVGCVPMRKQL